MRILGVAVIVALVMLELVTADCPNNCSNRGSCQNNVCVCQSGWTGEDCSYQSTIIANNTQVSGRLAAHDWAYYVYALTRPGSIRFEIEHEAGGDCDLYIYPNSYPTRNRWYMRDISVDLSTHLIVPNASPAVWYAGVYAFSACNYQFKVIAYPGCPKNCSRHGICVNGACRCDSGYAGEDCSHPNAQVLQPGVPILGESIKRGEWKFYKTDGIRANSMLHYTLNQTTSGDADLFVQINSYPNFTNFLARDTSLNPVSHVNVRAILPNTHTPATFYAGVFGFIACSYNLELYVNSSMASCRDHTNCSMHGTCAANGARCQCHHDYTGANCETKETPLEMGSRTLGHVEDNTWNYYKVASTGNTDDLLIKVDHLNTTTGRLGDCDLFVRANQDPTRTQFDYSDVSVDPSFNMTVPNPETENVVWHIGIFGWRSCTYELTVMPATGMRDCGPHGTPTSDGRCTCNDYYAGEDCDIPTTALVSNQPVRGQAHFNKWTYFHISPPETDSSIGAQALEIFVHADESYGAGGNVWLYVSQIEWPTLRLYDQADTHPSHYHSVFVDSFYSDAYIGVYASPYADPHIVFNFTIVAWYPDF